MYGFSGQCQINHRVKFSSLINITHFLKSFPKLQGYLSVTSRSCARPDFTHKPMEKTLSIVEVTKADRHLNFTAKINQHVDGAIVIRGGP